MFTKTKTYNTELKELQNSVINKIKNYEKDDSDITEMLDFMSQFYNYSFRNVSLIRAQWSGACAVDSYIGWKRKGFTVNKGETSKIKIFFPSLCSKFTNSYGKLKPLKKATKEEKALIKQGKLPVSKKLIFRMGSVFDITQTNATKEDFPKLFPNRHVNYDIDEDAYNDIMQGVKKYADSLNVSMLEDTNRELGNAKGAFFPGFNTIMMNPQDTKGEKLMVLIHELAHASLHKETKLPTKSLELQAEMVNYLVSKHFNIDVEKESVKYIAGWTSNFKEMQDQDINTLLKETQETAKKIINTIEE